MFPLSVSTNITINDLSNSFNTLRVRQASQVLTYWFKHFDHVCSFQVIDFLKHKLFQSGFFRIYDLASQRQIKPFATPGCFQFVSSDNLLSILDHTA